MAPIPLPSYNSWLGIVGSDDVLAHAWAVKAWDLAPAGLEAEAARQSARIAPISPPHYARMPDTFRQFLAVCGTALGSAHNGAVRAAIQAEPTVDGIGFAIRGACSNIANAHLGTFGSRFQNISGIILDVAAIALPVAIAALGPGALLAWQGIEAGVSGPTQQAIQATAQAAREELANPAGSAADKQAAASILTGGFFTAGQSVAGIPIFVLIIAAVALLLLL